MFKDAPNMQTWKQIRDREAGKLRSTSFVNRIKSNRVSELQLSNYKDVVSAHKGGINSLQVLSNLTLTLSFSSNLELNLTMKSD